MRWSRFLIRVSEGISEKKLPCRWNVKGKIAARMTPSQPTVSKVSRLDLASKKSLIAERAIRGCVVLLAVFLVYAAASSWLNCYRLARQPFQFDYEEGNVLNAAVRIRAGLTPYPTPGSWPVVINCYGPISYYLSAALIQPLQPNFFGPRAATLAAALIVAVEVALLAWFFTREVLVSISFAACYLALPLVQLWAPLLRVDLIGLAFSLGGLILFCFSRRARLLVPLLFALALLCKITFLAAPATCALILIRERNWKNLQSYGLTMTLLLGASFAFLQWRTHGAFLFHQFGTHVDPLSWHNYKFLASTVLGQLPMLLALGLIASLRMKRVTEPLIYLLVSAASTMTALKIGSDSNHFLECAAALCIFAAVGFYEIRKMGGSPIAKIALIALCCGILIEQAWVHRAFYTSKGVVDGCSDAYSYISQHNQVLSENVGALVLTGRPVLLSNPFVYAQLLRHGNWPPGRVEQMVERKTADLVVIGKPGIIEQRWSAPFLAALASNYHLSRRFACSDAVQAFEPNPAQTQ